MHESQPSLIARDDTFLGVCEGLGEDLGIHANWLRLGFALGLFFNPLAAAGAYLAAGMLVFASRWFAPAPARFTAADAEAPAAAQAEAGTRSEPEPLPIAA